MIGIRKGVARSFWSKGGLTWMELGRRVVRETIADDVFGSAAKLSYYFLLALFPFFIFLTALLGFLAQTGSHLYQNLLSYIRPILPASSYTLVMDTLHQIEQGAGKGKLSFGILATLWAASNGLNAIIEGLNRAYEVKEARPWWKARLVAIILTVAFTLFLILALGLVLGGNWIGDVLSGYVGLRGQFDTAWAFVQWPLVVIFVLVAFTLLYRYAPDLNRLDWAHTIPGAVIAVVCWVLISLGFRAYLHFFNNYGATYGSLGAVITLMLWLYLTGAAVLIGGEVNSEVENAAAEAGVPETLLSGEKAPGEKRGFRVFGRRI